MPQDDFSSRVARIRHNCGMCHSYRSFQPHGKERPAVQQSLKELYTHFLESHADLRKRNAPGEHVMDAARKKRFVLDMIDACGACDKSEPRVREQIKML